MAINISDFDKIWASTSPLTPYSFTDANYQQGWNFVGATPPARQMWDSYMKWSDEKQQYIVNNFLPLSGGTMTGTIKRNGVAVVNTVDNTYTQYQGGTDETSSYICVYGKNHSTNPGVVNLRAYDGTNSHYLKLNPNGVLTWGGNDISPQNADETQSSADTSLPSGTQKTVHSFTLTKGTWLVLGRVYFPNNANGYRTGWFSLSDDGNAVSSQARCTAVPPSGSACWIQVMSILSVSSSTTYYLVASQNSGSTLNSSGGVVKFRLSSIV